MSVRKKILIAGLTQGLCYTARPGIMPIVLLFYLSALCLTFVKRDCSFDRRAFKLPACLAIFVLA